MKTKLLPFLLLFIVGAFSISAQENEGKKFKDKIYTGGNLGLTFGTYTNIMISPIIGARLNEKIYAGLGFEYQYTKDKSIEPALTYNQFGARLFSQYNIIPQLFAHLEFAGYSMERYNIRYEKERNFVPFIYVGGGYRQMISQRSFVSFRILFDVLQNTNSPYNAWDPIYSIGFGVGI
ncbi:hypothetical protein [Carboxylicivirga sp. N1Y90]|uniref:hypothetical protein n=1 Tax=Carboxylicivirga fragile TaxID=3417571 RepID=UPI003D357C16|nr:hypothetical protein [Marinilabiliaceae bacterium N1Y90]